MSRANNSPSVSHFANTLNTKGRIAAHYEAMEFRKAAAETRAIWAAGNEYLTRAAPWVKFKTDRAAAAVGVRTGLNLVALFARIAQPLIPATAARLLDALQIPDADRSWPDPDRFEGLDLLPEGHPISPPPVLFMKLEDATVADWSDQFGGAPAD